MDDRDPDGTRKDMGAFFFKQTECEFVISPIEIQLEADQYEKIFISTSSDCEWFASTNLEWIEYISNTAGQGNGIIEIKVNNAGNIEKNGELIIANQIVQIHYVPKLPKILAVEIESNMEKIQLTWDPFLDFNIFYHVYRSELINGLFYPINSFPINVLTAKEGFIDNNTLSDTNYCYSIKAENIDGLISDLSDPVCIESSENSDYDISFETYPKAIVNVGGNTEYKILVKMKDTFKGWIDVTCSGIPKSVRYGFYANGNHQGTSINHFEKLPSEITLSITIGSDTLPGEYPFEISFQNLWTNGSSPRRNYSLSLIALGRNQGGVFVNLEKNKCFQGEKIDLYGAIYPPLTNEPIKVLIDSEQIVETFDLQTGEMGFFDDNVILKTLPTGDYNITAQWIDENTNTYTSKEIKLIVEKQNPTLTLFRATEKPPEIDKDYSIAGRIIPPKPGQKITLKVYFQNLDRIEIETYIVYTDSLGKYQLTNPFFKNKGSYNLKSYWLGDESSIGCETNSLLISVGSPGRAIIVGGGKMDLHNTYFQVTQKLTTKMYQDLKRIGFNDESIYFMINTDMIDINYDGKRDNVVDNMLPTLNNFLEILDGEFVSSLNSETPLFIYFQGHGTRGGKLELLDDDNYLTADVIANKLDMLQNRTGCQVILMLEFCYSGVFIEKLSQNNRIIFTSVDSEHAYFTDKDAIHSFSRYFFTKIKTGSSLGKAFYWARLKINYPVPIMDDNGDKIPNEFDGLFAEKTYLGNNLIWTHPKIKEISAPVLLNENQTTAAISLSLNEDNQYIKNVYAQIISPRDQQNSSKDLVVEFNKHDFIYNPINQQYDAIITNLIEPGVYKIIIYAENTDYEKSEPEFIFIRTAHSHVKNDLNKDYAIDIHDIIYGLKILSNVLNYTEKQVKLSDVIECMIQISDF